MPKELCFRRTAAEALGVDQRTLTKHQLVEPIGFIEISGRKFPVYDREGIDKVTKQIRSQKNPES
jgi:hypothetical protein